MATTYAIQPGRLINSGDSGNTVILGDVDTMQMGAFMLVVEDGGQGTYKFAAPFVGTLQLVARSRDINATNLLLQMGEPRAAGQAGDNTKFQPVTHRPVWLNGAKVDGTNPSAPGVLPYGHTYATITTQTMTLVPASGLQVALLVNCGSGNCKVYFVPVTGESAVG